MMLNAHSFNLFIEFYFDRRELMIFLSSSIKFHNPFVPIRENTFLSERREHRLKLSILTCNLFRLTLLPFMDEYRLIGDKLITVKFLSILFLNFLIYFR